jgi:hypothetical protein
MLIWCVPVAAELGRYRSRRADARALLLFGRRAQVWSDDRGLHPLVDPVLAASQATAQAHGFQLARVDRAVDRVTFEADELADLGRRQEAVHALIIDK